MTLNDLQPEHFHSVENMYNLKTIMCLCAIMIIVGILIYLFHSRRDMMLPAIVWKNLSVCIGIWAWLMSWLADLSGWYWLITDITVLVYMFWKWFFFTEHFAKKDAWLYFFFIKSPVKFIMSVHWCYFQQNSLLSNCKRSCLRYISLKCFI